MSEPMSEERLKGLVAALCEVGAAYPHTMAAIQDARDVVAEVRRLRKEVEAGDRNYTRGAKQANDEVNKLRDCCRALKPFADAADDIDNDRDFQIRRLEYKEAREAYKNAGVG